MLAWLGALDAVLWPCACAPCVPLQEGPDEVAQHRLLMEDLNSVLLTLNERECGIIKMRYGLDDGEEKTLEEVGRAFDVSRGGGGVGSWMRLHMALWGGGAYV